MELKDIKVGMKVKIPQVQPEDIEPYEEAKVEKQPDLKFEPCVCSTRISVKIEDLKAINQAVHELNNSKSIRGLAPVDKVCVLSEELKKLKEILVKYGI